MIAGYEGWDRERSGGAGISIVKTCSELHSETQTLVRTRTRLFTPGVCVNHRLRGRRMNEDKAGRERGQWHNKAEYLLTCVGFAVGLGNVWRFPYLCQTYGGGAFLIPYLICLLLEGIPLIHLELAIGQRLKRGSIGVWSHINPLLGGLGFSSVVISFLVGLYYNVIVAWILWFLFNSFSEPLPWQHCPLNGDGDALEAECSQSGAVEYFWFRTTLNSTRAVDDGGGVQWWVAVCLCTAWAAVFVCSLRGIESTGKAVYVTATFPYIILLCFLIRGILLEGATDGLVYLFTPKMEILTNPRVWLDASTQIFYSLGLGFGGMIAFSSYNPTRNDCERDAVTIACINSATSIFASIPIFSILGFKAMTAYTTCLSRNILKLINEFDLPEMAISKEEYPDSLAALNETFPDRVASLDIEICDLQSNLEQAVSGTGLAFIIFTEAILNMPAAQVWSVLFFTMLFMLGLSSMFGHVEGILTPLLDLGFFPIWVPKECITGLICLVSLVIGVTFTQGSGHYWVSVFDGYVVSTPLLFTALCEITAVIGFYGYTRFSKDLLFMTGRLPNLYWQVMWRFVSPLLLAIIFIAMVSVQSGSALNYEAWNPDYDRFPEKELIPYPGWVVATMITLSTLPCLSVPAVALYRLASRVRSPTHSSSCPPTHPLTQPPIHTLTLSHSHPSASPHDSAEVCGTQL